MLGRSIGQSPVGTRTPLPKRYAVGGKGLLEAGDGPGVRTWAGAQDSPDVGDPAVAWEMRCSVACRIASASSIRTIGRASAFRWRPRAGQGAI